MLEIRTIARLCFLRSLWVVLALGTDHQRETFAQSGISSFNVTTVNPPNSSYSATAPSDAGNDINGGETYIVNYGIGTDYILNSYTINSSTFSNFLAPDTLILQRTDGGTFVNIWYTLNNIDYPFLFGTTELNLDGEEVEDADAIYQTGSLISGYDNILVNVDDQASGSIQAQTERVDVIWYTGIVTCAPNNAVFPVIERGGNDDIKIAAITSLDVNGNPASYSNLVDVEDTDWPQIGAVYNDYLILRRQTVGQNPLPLLNTGVIAGQTAQVIQGVAVSFSELGIAANQVVYGYSLFAFDTNDVDHDLTDIQTFPTTTSAEVSGLDLVAGVSAAVSSDNCLTLAVGPGGYKSSLDTWLKANVAVTASTDGVAVTDWQDQWIANHDAVTSTGSPLYRNTTSNINFNPTVDFGSGSNTLTIANNTDFNTAGPYSSKGITMAFRTSSSDISTRQVIYEQGGNTRGMNVYVRDGDLHVTAWNRSSDGAGSPWNNSGNVNTVSAAVDVNTEYIVTLEYLGNSSSSGTLTAYLNGQVLGSLSGVGLLYSHTGGIEIGASDGGSEYDDGSNSNANSYYGEISELIYCNEPGSFTSAERQRTESYLALKYGITLNQSTAQDYYGSSGEVLFRASKAASIGGYLEYNNDIGGIGRDDGSQLEQQKSRSENNGSVVTFDHGGSFSESGSWLVWGNDGGSAADSETSDVPPVVGRRISRIWRVSESGETNDCTVSFDLSALSLSGGTGQASDYSLLVASLNSGGVFSSATVTTGASLSGNTLTFSGVDLSHGEYFTLGTSFATCAPGGASTGLGLWLRADLGAGTAVNGAEVTTWADRAGSNSAVASGNGPAFLSSSMNYNPALDFDAANEEELSGSAGFSSPAYYVVLSTDLTYNSSSTSETVLEFTVPATATDQFGSLLFGSVTGAFSGEVVTHAIGGTGTRWRRGVSQTGFGTINQGSTYLFGIRNNAAGNSTSMFINGRDRADLSSGTFLTSSNVGYRIGGSLDSDTYEDDNFDGKIAEVISYSSRPSDTEHARIQSYLALKYGVTLNQTTAQNYVSSSGTIIWSASGNTGYANAIAGIGRDDASCLEQKQSKSNVSGSIAAIGHGSIAASNSANLNGFDADESFMVWGHNGGSTAAASKNTVDVPSPVTARMARVWKVDVTGTVDAVSISFNLSGLGLSQKASDYHLIVSSSSTMASGTAVPGGSFNGDVLTFSNVSLSDGFYFSLGTERSNCGPGGVTSNLALWLKGDEGTNTTVDGANLTSWEDQSSVGRDAGATTLGGAAAVLPTYETNDINFNSVASITDPNSTNAVFLETSGGNNVSEALSVVAVFRTGQSGGSTTDFEAAPAIIGAGVSSSTADYGLGISNGRLHFKAFSGAGIGVRSPSGVVYNDLRPYIATGTRARSTATGSVALYANSASVATGVSTNTSLSAPTSFGIGNHDGANVASQFNGRVAEAIVFSSVLTADQRQRVESYLAIKYGITRAGGTGRQDYTSSSGSAVWSWAEQSSYNNGLAGIARDDNGCFLQEKSISSTDDAMVTVDATGVLGTNSSFMMWGHNNSPIEGTLAEGNTEYDPSQVSGRLFREWYVQETGTVGTVSVTFDLSQVEGPEGSGTANLQRLRLMVDSDGNFTAGVTLISPSAVDAVERTATFTVNFADGVFFTLGSEESAALPVELIAFTAKPEQNKVVVEWETASEQGNSYFTIERSSDGRSFLPLKPILGAGNSSTSSFYTYLDEKPLSGVSYYRLRQTDHSGEETISQAVRVVMPEITEVAKAKIFPNPAYKGQEVTVAYEGLATKSVGVEILDTRGVRLTNLTDLLKTESDALKINTLGMKQGVYVLVLKESLTGYTQSFKFLVQ